MATRIRRSLLVTLVLLVCGNANSQDASPTLERIRESGVVRIGFVPDAPPMSFLDQNGNAVGYSIDLCRHIAGAVRDQLGLERVELAFEALPSMESRLAAIESGNVDIECGATTVTLSRRERVDFTLMSFITGGALLSMTKDPIQAAQQIDGKSVAVISDTTTEANLSEFITTNEFRTEIVKVADREAGVAALSAGRVDAFASDRAMLVGLAFLSGRDDFAITQDIFSFEPYALVVARGDDEFRLAADRALAALYRSGRIRRIYHNWFGRYGLAMSPVVEAMFEVQAVAN